ncbi:MAG: glyoxylase-like metal-dependent hydrolase (beta-lactamase superfamily II) [Candidatus Azotimanducaceae bacterium]
MIKFLLRALGLVVFAGTIYLASRLWPAHRQIDSLNPKLPSVASIKESAQIEGLPFEIEIVNTASQWTPLSSILKDDRSDKGYEMTFPAFLIKWEDGRQFLVDAGLTKTTANKFGTPSEILGAKPMEFHKELGEVVDLEKINGVGFTHLHLDHVDGAKNLCSDTSDLKIVQSHEQYTQANYGTIAQYELLDNLACGKRLLVRDNLILKTISGFPGLYIVNTAGHTPGSQVFIAHIKRHGVVTTYVLAGDLVNHKDGYLSDIPKPMWFSYFVVPENLDQLRLTRFWLKDLDEQNNINVLPSHDLSSTIAFLK